MIPSHAVSRWPLALALLLALGVQSAAHGADEKPGNQPSAHVPLGFSVANMDKTADPRRDFYRFAAGGWTDRVAIPDADPDIGGFGQLQARLDAQLLGLIRQAAQDTGPLGSPTQQVGDFYRAAIDLRHRDQIGLRPIQADLDQAAQVKGAAPLAAFAARLQRQYGASPLVNAGVGQDLKDSTRMVLELVPGIQSLNQDEYTQPASAGLRSAYAAHIARMFQTLGDTPAQAKANAATVLAMETELAAARLTPVERRDMQRIYNLLTVDEAQALVPALDLRRFLQDLGAKVPERMLVPDLRGLKALQQMLTERPAQDWQTLLRWHVLTSRPSDLGSPWRDLDLAFARERKGLSVSEPLDRELSRQISTLLFHPLSRLYVKAWFPASTRAEVKDMVGHIKQEFELRLKSNPWLDEPTRQAALQKLADIDVQVGAPKDWIDFSPVKISPTDHFGNLQRIQAFLLDRDLARLGRPVVRERFADPSATVPTVVNAAYDSSNNSIDITAAIVQPPFFVPGADAAVNYCTVGAVIGHEMTHGFDSLGRQFDAKGNLRDWWTPATTAEFTRRTDVLVDQFSRYEVLPGLMHNGRQTVGENTADLGGITLAHAALRRATAGQKDPMLDGMSRDQRCFTAWTQLWAYKARPERLRLLVSIDYHSISSLRGPGALVHLDAFHEAFGIREGDPMWRAPAQRVRIW